MKKKMFSLIDVLFFTALIFLFFTQTQVVHSVGSKAGNAKSLADLGSKNIKSSSPNLSKSKTDNNLSNMQMTGQVPKKYVDGEVLVKYKSDKINLATVSGRVTALSLGRSKSLEKKEDLTRANISLLKIADGKSVEEKVAELKKDPNVEYAEPNYRRYLSSISTNDPSRGQLWGLDNTGQMVNGTTGTADKDIDAPEAWTVNEGINGTVIVAVIDTGVAYNHPDLSANMWDGTNCKDYNGNSLGSCSHGYDFEDNDKIPLPASSTHGTHVAGTIAAAKNNSKGIVGVAPKSKIMAIKFGLDTVSEVKSIDFAIQNGAKVINASYAGGYSQAEYDAISRFKDVGGIFVAAAGNESSNNENSHLYPSDYNLDNIISVAATDQNDNLASFSNYGATSVDVGAPGTNIYSTIAGSSSVLNETFESLVPPNIPSGWTKTGNWGTYQLDNGIFWGKVLYGDLDYPYADNANTTVTSSAYNLSTGGSNIDFWARCDTEYITNGWADYMQLEYSADGVNFYPAVDPYSGAEFRWDEAELDMLNGDANPAGSATYHFENIPIPSQYSSSNFKLRFRWVTNASDNNYDGCLVDDVKITKLSDGSDEKYGYMEGTSMATPHVAGLAALIEGYNPALTSTQVKNTILTSGDDIPSLHGKTSAGTRINAYKALLASAAPIMAGTTGKSLRLEAVQIKLDNSSPGVTVRYRANVQNIGWQGWVSDGATAGTTGQRLRTEAMQIELVNPPPGMAVQYRAHVQNIGWQEWVSDGATAGTTGRGLQVEAIQIRLVNPSAGMTVQYRAHVQNIGWQEWVSDGATQPINIQYKCHIQNIGWTGWVYNEETCGTTGRGLQVEAMQIKLDNLPEGMSVRYRAHVQNIGWQGWVSDGATAGTTGRGLQIEAMEIELVNPPPGTTVRYRAHVQNIGWQGWVSDGATAGTTGRGLQIEAIQIGLVNN